MFQRATSAEIKTSSVRKMKFKEDNETIFKTQLIEIKTQLTDKINKF
jgi:hypothetical protein